MLIVESFRFWMNVFAGNLVIGLLLYSYKQLLEFGKKYIIDVVVTFVFVFVSVICYDLFQREMDTPSVLAMNYQKTEGTVIQYDDYAGDRFVGSSLSIEEKRSGDKIDFIQTYIPSSLEIGDSVKVSYLKYSKVAIIDEINNKKINYHIDNNHTFGIIIIIYLILSMPCYYLRNFKWNSILDYKEDYSVYVYHDKFIYVILGVFFIKLQTSVVLIMAILGNYKSSWDWYWGTLIVLNYLSTFLLCFMKQKKFILIKDKFFYRGMNKRIEGELADIELVKETNGGVRISAKEGEMEIFCTAKKKIDVLLKKLHKVGEN